MDSPIIFADDEESQRFMIHRILKKLTTRPVLPMVSGHLVLEYLIEHQHDLPHVIFCDENMPIMGGLDLLTEINQRKILSAPIVILTSSKDDRKHQVALGLGAADYLEKTNTMGNLLLPYL
jgi:CheY-like chemotaxis protein